MGHLMAFGMARGHLAKESNGANPECRLAALRVPSVPIPPDVTLSLPLALCPLPVQGPGPQVRLITGIALLLSTCLLL